jgi:hypothetical protein
METPLVNPLTQEHLEQINRAIADGDNALNHVVLAERAGIDVGKHKESITANVAKLRKIKQVYFPNQ